MINAIINKGDAKVLIDGKTDVILAELAVFNGEVLKSVSNDEKDFKAFKAMLLLVLRGAKYKDFGEND